MLQSMGSQRISDMTERLNRTDRILSSVGFQHMSENQYLGVIGEFYSKISNTESL